MSEPAGVAVNNGPARRALPGFCRDCRRDAPDGVSRCPACGSPRLLRHPELDALAIAHVDCDAFYATIEKRDDPTLADKPVIVGGRQRGVVLTGLLRGAHVRRAIGDADVRSAAAVPARQRGPARHGEIRARRPRGARAHVQTDATGRAGLDRRSVHGPVRHRAPARHVAGQGARALCRRRRTEPRDHRVDRALAATSSSPRSPPIWTSRAASPSSARPRPPRSWRRNR